VINAGATGTMTAGSGATPGGTGDPAYVSGVGVGGAGSTSSPAPEGSAGYVVVSW